MRTDRAHITRVTRPAHPFRMNQLHCLLTQLATALYLITQSVCVLLLITRQCCHLFAYLDDHDALPPTRLQQVTDGTKTPSPGFPSHQIEITFFSVYIFFIMNVMLVI